MCGDNDLKGQRCEVGSQIEIVMRPSTHASTKARPLTAFNVDEVADLIRREIHQCEMQTFDAVEACRILLAAGSMIGTLVDQIVPGRAVRAIGVGGAAFVERSFAISERDHPAPGLNERVLRSAFRPPGVALTARQIANGWSEGLTVAVILHNWFEGEPESSQKEIRRCLMTTFLDDLSGYNLSELIVEAPAERHMQWALNGGFRVRSAYDEWYRENLEPQPRRMLFGITREEALKAESSLLSLMFHYQPPRFDFTPSQRRLLAYAVQLKTDSEIADHFGISLSAVKKSWAAIFEKVGNLLPTDASETASDTSDDRAGIRGAQKRHRLLSYLRNHPEEFRP